jgi:hypothetical protein
VQSGRRLIVQSERRQSVTRKLDLRQIVLLRLRLSDARKKRDKPKS